MGETGDPPRTARRLSLPQRLRLTHPRPFPSPCTPPRQPECRDSRCAQKRHWL
jgi:hypothetical protein